MTEPGIDQALSWKSRLEISATILLVLVTLMVGGFAIVDRFHTEPPRQIGVKPVGSSISIPIADSPVLGSRAAKVALVEFSDFQCPVCRRAAQELLPNLKARYVDTGKVLLVWRHDPLKMHPDARGAAEAAECGSRQGKFWGLHDWAFVHQQSLSTMRDAAKGLRLNMPEFDRCIGGEAAAKITGDLELASKLGVDGTPTWFIGTLEPDGTVKPVDRIDGLAQADVYGKAIDKLLQPR